MKVTIIWLSNFMTYVYTLWIKKGTDNYPLVGLLSRRIYSIYSIL